MQHTLPHPALPQAEHKARWVVSPLVVFTTFTEMGFNIGIWSDEIDRELAYDCNKFIPRRFYNFIDSYNAFGEFSIIFQAAKYYKIELLRLTKLVYEIETPSDDYVKQNLQEAGQLINLIDNAISRIDNDPSICDLIKFKWKEDNRFGNKTIDEKEAKTYEDLIILKMINKDIKQMNQNKYEIENPFIKYFEEKLILEDLKTLKTNIKCLVGLGAHHVYLTAG